MLNGNWGQITKVDEALHCQRRRRRRRSRLWFSGFLPQVDDSIAVKDAAAAVAAAAAGAIM